MKRSLGTIFTIILMTGNACQEKIDKMSDEQSVINWMERFIAFNNAGVFEKYGSFWTEDAVLLPPDAPIIKGKAAILKAVRPFFTDFNVDQKGTVEEVRVVENFAFIRTDFTEKYTPLVTDTEPFLIHIKAIFLLKKNSDSSWVATHCIWNYNSPLVK